MEDNHHFHEALRAYRKVAAEINEKIKAKEPLSSDLVRHAGWVLALLLRAYALPENWRGSTPVSPLPPDITADIARNIEIVCGGHIPRWMLHLQKRGTVPADPKIRQWQGMAAAYVKLCRVGIIVNPAPVANVAKIYGVDRKTVQAWVTSSIPNRAIFSRRRHPKQSAANG